MLQLQFFSRACRLSLLWFLAVALPLRAQDTFDDTLRLNQVQVIGSHNSFKAAIDPQLLDAMKKVVPKADRLDYSHPPLTEQLNFGLHNLELDLFHDPNGGRYAQPWGQKVLAQPLPYDLAGDMLKPGFKVMHVQDIDYRSNCPTLVGALKELIAWSTAHPRHLPVLITLNVTDRAIPLPGSVEPLPFDAAALDALDQAFVGGFGKHLLTPDEVRGKHATLEAAILAEGWPTLATARGRFLLVLDDTGKKRDTYLDGHATLQGRAMFVNAVPGEPAAGIMIRNNPIRQQQEISRLVRQGYLVRTRADAELQEARKMDLTRFEAAKRCGAQAISTDFYQADPRYPEYVVRFPEGYMRLNPVNGGQ